MTIKITTFSAPQKQYQDKRRGDFALAFDKRERRCASFANILVDATWATWMPHQDFPANVQSAKLMLKGCDSYYPDSFLVHINHKRSEQAKQILAALMVDWTEGKSTVFGHSVEESITLAYREKGDAGLFVFITCSYLESSTIGKALQQGGLKKSDYAIVQTEEERSGEDFLSSMRDNDLEWFETLVRVGIVDDKCRLFNSEEEDDDD